MWPKLKGILSSFPSLLFFLSFSVIVLAGVCGVLVMGKELLERPNLGVGLFIFLPLMITLAGWMGLRYLWNDGGTVSGPRTLLDMVVSFARGNSAKVEKRFSASVAPTFQRRTQTPEKVQVSATPERASRRPSKFRYLFLFFFVAGGALSAIFYLRTFSQILALDKWQATPCRILSSQVKHPASETETIERLEIVYRYNFNGQEYITNRFHLSAIPTLSHTHKVATMRRHPPGLETVCYVNPVNPAEAVLDRDFSPDLTLGLLPLGFAVVGVAGSLLMFRGASPGRRARLNASRRGPAWPARSSTSGDPLKASLPKRKQADSGVGLKLDEIELFLIIFGLFWHAFAALWWWRAGWDAFGVGISGIVGLLMYWLAGYFYLQRFLPDTDLRLSAETLALGEAVDVAWEVGRGVEKIRRLTILLKGQEEIKEDPPEDSHPYADDYWKSLWQKEFRFLETIDRGKIAHGKILITIPTEIQPTFSDSDRKVTWRVHLDGETAWYLPDLTSWRNVTIVSRPAKNENMKPEFK